MCADAHVYIVLPPLRDEKFSKHLKKIKHDQLTLYFLLLIGKKKRILKLGEKVINNRKNSVSWSCLIFHGSHLNFFKNLYKFFFLL